MEVIAVDAPDYGPGARHVATVEQAAAALSDLAAGDAVLVALSERIKDTLRKGDFAARIGGDEFIVIIDPLDDAIRPEGLAARIRASASQPIALPR